jgi:hypothetical protein
MAKPDIRKMAEALYDDPDVASAVVEDANKHGNVAKIESGELFLPHPHDAATWHNRNKGEFERQSDLKDAQARIAALEERLASLTSAKEH